MGLKDFNGYGCILADDMGLGKTLQQPGWVSFKKKTPGGFRGFFGWVCVLWRSFGWSPGFEFFQDSKGWRKTFGTGRLFLEQSVVTTWVVVSNIFYFHPYLGKWSNFTNMFQMGWNHQPATVWAFLVVLWEVLVDKIWATNRSFQHSQFIYNHWSGDFWMAMSCHCIHFRKI